MKQKPPRKPKQKRISRKRFPWPLLLALVTGFQLLSAAQVLLRVDEPEWYLIAALLGYPALQWGFMIALRIVTKQDRCEPELLACWLSGIGLTVSASFSTGFAWRQALAIAGGMVVYAILRWCIADPDRAMKLRPAVAVGAMGLLVLNLALALAAGGNLRWIHLGGFSIQPSELVKIAFVFVGAATLERLQRTQSILRYLIFAMACVGALFYMNNFGTALIFFVTFLFIIFMRTGDMRSIAFICAAALMAAVMILRFRPIVAGRFAVYRQVWDYMHEGGFQQTRVLIYSSSGGLFGLGIGNGRLRFIFAATTDLIFGVIAEEMGLIVAFLIPLCYIGIAIYALRAAQQARSSFYTIAAVSATGLLIFQAALNIFGITDLLPLTGVTLPFVSRGGTSMLSVWGMLGFIAALRESKARKPRKEKDLPLQGIRFADHAKRQKKQA